MRRKCQLSCAAGGGWDVPLDHVHYMQKKKKSLGINSVIHDRAVTKT